MKSGMNIYWGDLHNHCGITYGYGSLENAIKRAASQLDFCAFTGHAMWPDMYEKVPETEFVVNFHQKGFQKLKDHWTEIRKKVADANSADLVTFQGYEMHSGKYGDHHLVSINDNLPLVYRDSPADLVKACGKDTIAVPHHIGYTPGYRGINWDEFDSNISPIVEVYSKHGCAMGEYAAYPYYHNMGPRDTRNMVDEGLRRGYCFSFVASTDHHAGFPGSYGDGLAAVIAEEKTRKSIWKAIKEGRTYAVTGDKILCDFRVNDVCMGGHVRADRRKIEAYVETEAPLDKLIIYKNEKVLRIINGEEYQQTNSKGCYKLRLEMGWGDPSLYRWEGRVKVEDGTIESWNTCFRGLSVLAPTMEESYDENAVNDIATESKLEDGNELFWKCDTVGNKSTLHPSTSMITLKIRGSLETRLSFCINNKNYNVSVRELLEYGYTCHMKYYHSQAFKIYKALPETQYLFHMELEDWCSGNTNDIYRMEVSQKNGQWAYVSPVYAESIL